MVFPYLSQYFRAAWELLFPRRCLMCGLTLSESEEYLCATCRTELPLTRLRGGKGNAVERLFYDLEGAQRGSAFLIYRTDNAAYRLIHRMKYHNRPDIGVELGQWMAYDLEGTGFFDGIDALVPVPLSKKKQRKRGYNQSERIAYGLSSVTGIPVCTDLVSRIVHNPTQTNLTPDQRRRNVEGIFAVTNAEVLRSLCISNETKQEKGNGTKQSEGNSKKQAERNGKKQDEETTPHLLLIDDVITTGSTLRSLAETLTAASSCRLSFLAAALAGPHFNIFKKGAS